MLIVNMRYIDAVRVYGRCMCVHDMTLATYICVCVTLAASIHRIFILSIHLSMFQRLSAK